MYLMSSRKRKPRIPWYLFFHGDFKSHRHQTSGQNTFDSAFPEVEASRSYRFRMSRPGIDRIKGDRISGS